MSYKIEATKRFKKELKILAKKYKKIKVDYKNLLDLLEKYPTSGAPLGNNCYKVRVPNSSIPTGKSGGFRVITFIRVEKEKVVLLTIYAKTEKENISEKEINEILEGIE